MEKVNLTRKIATIVLLSLMFLGALYVAAVRPGKGVERGRVAMAWRARRKSQVGGAAPDFTLPDLDGDDVRFSDFRGKVILLNFWTTRCLFCRRQTPSMEILYQKFKGRDFELLAISLDRRGASVVGPFVRDYKLTFPVLLDSKGEVGNIYGVRGIPVAFIIDKEGLIVEKVVGARDWSSPDSIEKFQRLISKD